MNKSTIFDTKIFLQVLFDRFDETCFSHTPYGTSVCSVSVAPATQFVCINPLFAEQDLGHAEGVSRSPRVGRRADINVSAFRNILCEFDKGSFAEQKAIVQQIPYSTLVHSGGKSLHAIISLKTPCKNIEEYRRLVKRIYAKLSTVDKSGSNPSRFTRLPGVIRNNGNLQELLDIRGRITTEALEAWLGPEQVQEPEEHAAVYLTSTGLNKWTKYFLAFGAEPGSWNSSLFKAACDLARNGFSPVEASALLEKVTGHLDATDRRTIKSAFQNVKAD